MNDIRVYIEVNDSPPTACGPAWAALVRAAGGQPFMPPPTSSVYEVSWEEVLEFDPQLVIYAIPGLGQAKAPEDFLTIEGWNRTEAAVEGRVFSVERDLLDGPQGAEFLKNLINACFNKGAWPLSSQFRNLKNSK